MKIYIFENKKYYLINNVKENHPELFIDDDISSIPNDKIYYAKKINYEWIESTKNNKKAKIFIRAKWFDKYQIEFYYDILPPLIKFKNDEQFYLNDKLINLEMRGEKEFDKIFISIDSVCEKFSIKNINKIILNEGYVEKFHYVYFRSNNGKNNKNLLHLYFTFTGYVEFIFTTKELTDLIIEMRDWMTKKTCITAFGSKKQKCEMIREMKIYSDESSSDEYSSDE